MFAAACARRRLILIAVGGRRGGFFEIKDVVWPLSTSARASANVTSSAESAAHHLGCAIKKSITAPSDWRMARRLTLSDF
jgi:hypothetical protein